MGSRRVGYTRTIGLDGFPLAPLRGASHKTRRYDGQHKTSRSWDCLRRDAELWIDDGDCLVHLYGPGMSKRGPSFRIPYKAVEKSRSGYLLEQCLQKSEPSSPTSATSDDDSSDSGYGASICSDSERTELYIRAPAELPRNEAFQYHIGTRNFFAYLLGKPLVGESLGKALVELANRIELWQKDGTATTEFLDYLEEQGYLGFAENPDYAAASLYLADRACIKDIWVDAFAHCVGMRDDVESSPEAADLSNRTKALIMRAALEMELHIIRVTKAVGSFLEEELGPEHLGISKPLRNHLDRFRSLLHSHYVNQFGYFPPESTAPWNKQIWYTIFEDFRSLYEYLADSQSSDDRSSIRGVNGGVCVIQNLHAFDKRHGYFPLPHPLPLLPEVHAQAGIAGEVQKGLRSFRLGRAESQPLQTSISAKEALARASNTSNPGVLSNRLVQEYIRFEKAKLEERVSVSEARKVRWILVYSVLQMLISITRAPTEVQDTETPSYPLCVLTAGSPQWMEYATMTPTGEIQQQTAELEGRLSAEMDNVRRTMETDRISIHPDCEADNAEDYFTMNNSTLSRSASDVSIGMIPSPLRTNSYLSRTASLRSGMNSLQRSVVGSFSRRNSTRRLSLAAAPAPEPIKESPFREIVVASYGNGLEDSNETNRLHEEESEPIPIAHTPLAELEGSYTRGIPTLELHQLHIPDHHPREASHQSQYRQQPSPAESQISHFSTPWSEAADAPNSSSSDLSPSPMENECPSSTHPDNTNNFSAFDFDFLSSTFRQPEKPAPTTYRATTTTSSSSKNPILTAGTYIPTGSTPLPSSGGFRSSASSCYGDEEQPSQAAEIEEEESRGRRRLRGLDRLSKNFGIQRGEIISLPSSPC